MFYLPVFVNQSRFHYAKLQSPEIDEAGPAYSFVVQQAPGHQVELLRIYGGSIFISARGTASDEPFSLDETGITCNWQGEGQQVLELHFHQGDASPEKSAEAHNETLAGSGLTWKTEARGGDLYLVYNGSTTEPIRIVCILHLADKSTYGGQFLLHTAAPEQIFDAVFDFGSEASQIAFHQRRSEPGAEPRINMLDRLLFSFYGPALASGTLQRHQVGNEGNTLSFSDPMRERYMPYDRGPDRDEYLFNSNFFVRRSYQDPAGESNDPLPHALPFADGNMDWVSILGDSFDPSYLSPKTDADFEIIPNLKLAELGLGRSIVLQVNDRLGRFSDAEIQEDIFRRTLGQFIHLLCREMDDRVRKQKRKFLKLTLLVPNIYSQLRVNTLVSYMYTDIAAIIEEGNYNIAGFEVQTLSESDAALLGLITDAGIAGIGFDKIKPKDNCLVIDSGKGTTDISILNIGRNSEFGSVFRSGFAGAGNALTYAFADTLFAMLLGPEDMAKREYFLHKFLSDQHDLGTMRQFLEHMENIKKRFGKHEDASYTLTAEALQAIPFDPEADNYREVLNDILKVHFTDPRKTMQDYLGIVESTIDQMVNKTVDSLRGAEIKKFDLVVFSGRSFLMQEYRDRMEAALRAEFSIKEVFFAKDNLKKSCLIGPLNHPDGTNYNSGLVGTPVFTTNGGRFRKIRALFNFERNSAELNDEEFFLHGITLRHNETVAICGRRPLLRDIPTGHDANLIYVGEDFLVRTEDTSAKLDFGFQTKQTTKSDPLAWMSLFPYVKGEGHLTKAKTIPIPEPELETVQEAAVETPVETRTPQPNTSGRSSPFENDDMWNDL